MTRHIDIRYRWINIKLETNPFTIRKIRTTEMTADGLTKPLMKTNRAKFVKLLGMVMI
jgi:hypothetical protein